MGLDAIFIIFVIIAVLKKSGISGATWLAKEKVSVVELLGDKTPACCEIEPFLQLFWICVIVAVSVREIIFEVCEVLFLGEIVYHGFDAFYCEVLETVILSKIDNCIRKILKFRKLGHPVSLGNI